MTQFAKRFTKMSGTASLMEDLGSALNERPDMIAMGGGNPAQIDTVERCIAEHLTQIAQNPKQLHKLVGEYQSPQGDPNFLNVLAEYLRDEYGWPVSTSNIAIANGGQSAFFTLFNMLAGNDGIGNTKKILLPMVPDYLGYADTGLSQEMFESIKPLIQTEGHFFKYHIDFNKLSLSPSIAAVCLSRPTNPSGNIITTQEMEQLHTLCQQHNIPLIIDAAYGKPFPGITFVNYEINWNRNTIFILSLSKFGLPGVRTGIIIAEENTIRNFARATASLSLSPCSLGPSLCKSLLDSGDFTDLSKNTIQPFYYEKMQETVTYLISRIGNLPIKIHRAEGAFFLWLWFQDLPISSQMLYENLKEKGLLVISGHHFFQALNDLTWPHQHQCIRINYCQSFKQVKKGIDLLIEELVLLYS